WDRDEATADGVELALLDDCRGAPVRRHAEGDRPLGDDVRKLPQLVDDLVEMEVRLAEAVPGDVPVELLPHQRERDQLDGRELEQVPRLLARVPADRRQMSLGLRCCHCPSPISCCAAPAEYACRFMPAG